MTAPEVPFRIETAAPLEHDGTRHVIAAGTWPLQEEAERKADDALLGDLADAMREQEGKP